MPYTSLARALPARTLSTRTGWCQHKRLESCFDTVMGVIGPTGKPKSAAAATHAQAPAGRVGALLSGPVRPLGTAPSWMQLNITIHAGLP